LIFLFFILHFLCSPKENEAKERAPGVPLDPALLKTGGALSNSAPKRQGPQTAKGPFPARFCDARRGTMGIVSGYNSAVSQTFFFAKKIEFNTNIKRFFA